MNVTLLLLLLAPAQDRYENKQYSFDLVPPRGWERRRVERNEGAMLARWRKAASNPRDRSTQPDVAVRRVEGRWPSPMDEMIQNLKEFLQKRFPDGLEEKFSKKETIDGLPAFLTGAVVKIVPRDKEKRPTGPAQSRFVAYAIIQRTLLEHFFIDLIAPPARSDTNRRIFEEMVRSFRSHDVSLTPDQEAGLRRFNALAESWGAQEDVLVYDEWLKVLLPLKEGGGKVLKRKLGYYHVRALKADVQGAPGIAFETRLDLVNLKSEHAVTVTRGAFRLDLSFQKTSVIETVFDAKGNVTRRHDLSAVTKDGGFEVRRTIAWKGDPFEETVHLTPPPGTVLTGVQEVLRRGLAARGRNRYVCRLLYIPENRARVEVLEVFKEETTSIAGVQTRVRAMHARRGQGRPVAYDFSPKGVLLRERIGAGSVELVRTTEKDARKPPLAPPKEKP